jgi:hypothetical protein
MTSMKKIKNRSDVVLMKYRIFNLRSKLKNQNKAKVRKIYNK